MRGRLSVLVVIFILFHLTPVASAGFTVDVGYGSGSLIESPDDESKDRTGLFFGSVGGEWRFPETEWGLGFNVVVAASDTSLTNGLQRVKAGLIYGWDNIQFFAGPTWTSYQDQSGQNTSLEGIEMGGNARVDFTQNLHLEGLFSFSPVLEGVSITLPDPHVDTSFIGNISEYYFGLLYDFGPRLSASAGIGGWRVLEPYSQDRLVTVDYRRFGLDYKF